MIVFVLCQEGLTEPVGLFSTLEKAKDHANGLDRQWKYCKVMDAEPEQWRCEDWLVLMYQTDYTGR